MGSGARFVVRGERKRAVALRELGASAQEYREDELRQEDAHEHGQGGRRWNNPRPGALLPAVALAKASAGGSVFEPAMSPMRVK